MSTTGSVLSVALAGALTMAGMACGGAAPPAGSADTPKTVPATAQVSAPESRPGICSYITEAEASEILGQASKYRGGDDSSNCIVDPASGNHLEGLSVDFSLEDGDGRYGFLLRQKGEAIDGLGDRAVWSPTLNALAAVKGSRTVGLTITSFGKRPDLKEKAVAFAQKVVGRL